MTIASERSCYLVHLIDGVGRSRYLDLREPVRAVRIPIPSPFDIAAPNGDVLCPAFGVAEFSATGERDDAGLPIYRMSVRAR